MADLDLSKEELDRALKFEGYGNKAASFWYIAMEEGGGSVQELRKRVRQYDPVEHLHSGPAKLGLDTKFLHVPTWRVMSKLVIALQGKTGWRETSSAREYQANELGRADGDTFLAELMPLPARSIGVWPYEAIYSSRKEYYADVRPRRIEWLRSEVRKFRPSWIICYGKSNWRYYEEIFRDVRFKPAINQEIRVGQDGNATILLLPFFAYQFVSSALIEQVANIFGQKITEK